MAFFESKQIVWDHIHSFCWKDFIFHSAFIWYFYLMHVIRQHRQSNLWQWALQFPRCALAGAKPTSCFLWRDPRVLPTGVMGTTSPPSPAVLKGFLSAVTPARWIGTISELTALWLAESSQNMGWFCFPIVQSIAALLLHVQGARAAQ